METPSTTPESIAVAVESTGRESMGEVDVSTVVVAEPTEPTSAPASRPKNRPIDSGSVDDSAIDQSAEAAAAQIDRPEIADSLVATEHNCYSVNQEDAHTSAADDGAPPAAQLLDGRSKLGKGSQGSTGRGGRKRSTRGKGVTLPAQNPAGPKSGLMSSNDQILQEAFLISYAIRGSIKGAAADLGLAMKQVIRWRDHDPIFAQCLAVAHEEYVSHLEDILDRKINANDKNAAILLMFKLKKENTQYRDKVDVKHSGGIGVAVTELSTEELMKIVRQGRTKDVIEGEYHDVSDVRGPDQAAAGG